MYIIATLKSRNSTMKLYNCLASVGVPCLIVNTPREAEIGCGLSIKFSPCYLHEVKRLIGSTHQHSFYGFFEVTEKNGQTRVRLL